MSTIMVLNGPNLNLLGTREPTQYGSETINDLKERCIAAASKFDHTIDFRQSNHEGVLIDAIHEAGERFKQGEILGIAFNPGAYTHTSIALHDAIKSVDVPVIEVHISNVHARETFRHHSYISPVAKGTIIGMGLKGYELAIQYITETC
ncbi:type II 3-dehydroquinate dehydratase [Photobacterium rosenbergii]|uniref:type II 3-dehydroquinate dehydratase n=1 Tax=Photobacterium rosenbergii TaxID=294936 RepID=UPI001C994E01|nr:type II 3-dehydroquinate dehydratase [Photobacterium rosenbergii]MBY5945688.1 type II 3-dehydroquinate dehydratase [Photobacterium rosenbergii]